MTEMQVKKQNDRSVPNLRFPEFEKEWEKKKLGEIAEVSSGGTPSRTNSSYWDGDIPWVSTTLIDFNIINDTEEKITEEGLKNSSAKLFPKGSLLMAMYGQGKTRGKVAMLGIASTTNQACASIMTNSEMLDSSFLFQNLSNRYHEIRDLSNQGGQENLSGTIIKAIEIVFPSLSEQKRIADFLSLVNEQILTQSKIIAQLQTLMQGLSEQSFQQQIRFKEDNGNDFPDGEEKRLGEVGRTYNGLSGKSKDDFGRGERYIQYKQIFDSSKIKIEDCGLVDISENENQNQVQYGDIFFTTSSETPEEIGMSSVLLDAVENTYLNSFCFGFRPNSMEILNPVFAQYFFRSETFRDDIIALAQGSTRYNLSKTEFMKLPIKLPCIEEQILIANFLSSVGEKIEAEKKILQQYESQKKYLLQNMFI